MLPSYISYMECASTIAISRNTRDMLKELGHKGQTYDQLINELIKAKTSIIQEDLPNRRVEGLHPREPRNS